MKLFGVFIETYEIYWEMRPSKRSSYEPICNIYLKAICLSSNNIPQRRVWFKFNLFIFSGVSIRVQQNIDE